MPDPCGGCGAISYTAGLDERGETVWDLMPCPVCVGDGPEAWLLMMVRMTRAEAGI